MKVQKETQQQQPFVLRCKYEAIVNKEMRVSKPPLLSPWREVLFLCRLGICSLSCLKVIAVLEMDI